LYVDEFQNFATESFVNILSEARKYRLDLTLGHQYIGQLITDGSPKMRDAVFGNVGTLVSFRVGAEDAEFLEKEFSPEFMATDIVNLPKYNIYLKLLIDGVSGNAFSAQTLAPYPKPAESNRDKIVRVSRERYATPRKVIEEKIFKWTGNLTGQISVLPQQAPQTNLYDAKCSSCGKWTKVIFPPDPSRPIYCKVCLKKIKGESHPLQKVPAQEQGQPVQGQREPEVKTSPSPSFSLNEAMGKEPVPFSIKKVRLPEERIEPKRKEVDIEDLKKTLEESLRDIGTKEDKKQDENTQKPKL